MPPEKRPEQRERRPRSGAMPDPYSEVFTESGRHQDSRAAERRTRQKAIRLGVVGVVAAIVVGLLLAIGLRSLRSDDSGTPAAPGQLPAASEDGGDASDGAAPATGPHDLFAGTPAAAYGRGAAAIKLPTNAKVDGWSSSDVQLVASRTKDALVAGRMSAPVMEKGDITSYLTKLAPGVRTKVQADIGKGQPALGYVTRLSPQTKLASQQVRVKGEMKVSKGKSNQLVINADFVWVYPLAPLKPPSPAPTEPEVAGSHLVVLHTVETYEWYKPLTVDKEERGLRPGAGQLYTFNMDCAQVGKGMLAPAPPGQKGRRVAPDDRAYNPSTNPSSLPSTC